MKRVIILACLIFAAACLAFAASDTPSSLQAIRSPKSEIQELQAKIAQAKANGLVPDPAWTARIEQLLPLTGEPQAPLAPPAQQISRNDILFTTPATMPAERPNTPLERQIQQLEGQLFTGSAAQPVISPSLKDQLNALYEQRPENHPMGTATQRPDTPLEHQISQLEDEFSRASGAEAAALKAQISSLYAERPENRVASHLDQGGDNCSSATAITTLPYHDTGTTIGYTDDFQPVNCGYAAGAPDLIYVLTAPHTGPYKISLCGSSFDTEVYVRTGGACPGSTEIACNDDYCGLQSQVTPTLTAGVTYYIIVDGYYNYSGAYVLNVIDFSGDDCSSAIPIAGLPYTDVSSTDSLTNNWNTASNCNSTNAPDRIYTFVARYTGSHTVSLCGSSYDTMVELRTGGTCPGTTQVACNDDNCGLQSSLTANLTAGVQYWIIVDGFSTHSGAYVLNVTDACSVVCQPGDIHECAETPSPTFGATDCDGGCNNNGDWQNPPNLFGSVLPFQIYCASSFTYVSPAGVNFRDTDWYQFTLSEPCSLEFVAISEFPLHSFLWAAVCPQGAVLAQAASAPCNLMVYTSPSCMPAGDYYLWFGPDVFDGIQTPRNYRFEMAEFPCSGCSPTATLLAPASYSGNTCGAGNNCGLRPSEDNIVRVNIPYESDWTFSLCGGSPNWDSYIYLTSQCCNSGAIIAQDDDGCGGVGLSVIHCAHLTLGSYYLTVEGYSTGAGYCGTYTLNVTECLGKCCYGGSEPACTFVTPTACQALSGRFTEAAVCSTGICYIRPSCLTNSQFSQPPTLPDEAWNGFPSDQAVGQFFFDNFSGLTSPIGTIRFWGFRGTGSTVCGEDPMPMHIRFFQDNAGNIGPLVATYDVTLSGTPGYIYPGYANFPIIQYSTMLNPPLNLGAGWVSVAGDGDPTCHLYWTTSNAGNGSSRLSNNQNGAGSSVFSTDFAVCIGPPCLKADSLVIFYDASLLANRLDFYCPQSGTYRIYATQDHNAVYPSTFAQIAVGTVPPGHYNFYDYGVAPAYKRYLIVQDCGSEAPPYASAPFGVFTRVEPTTTPEAVQSASDR